MSFKWKDIGLSLRLNPIQLKKIEKENSDLNHCLTEMLTLWLKGNYDTERFGEPSWELLARAVSDSGGGNNPALAEDIMRRHGGMYILCFVRFRHMQFYVDGLKLPAHKLVA